MKINRILNSKRATLSFEVFPPKNEDSFKAVDGAVDGIIALSPDFISVTYGAGGSTDDYTVAVAEKISNAGVTALAHLSCISATKQSVREKLDKLKEKGIENVLALRGDLPAGYSGAHEYGYANELVAEIKNYGGFCIGAACYPEGHPESPTLYSDIDNLKRKADAGCDFLTTQMFFDNDLFYAFLCKAQAKGIDIPIIAGIMPVTNASSIRRITALSGATLSARFKRILDRFGDNPAAMKQAGVAYATEQIIDLYANGIKAVHVYSMNKPDVAAMIKRNLSEIL